MVQNTNNAQKLRSKPSRNFNKGQYKVFIAHVALCLVLGGWLYFARDEAVWVKPVAIFFMISALTLKVAFHEFGHAYFAYKAGDYSVKGKGYLELNIFKYSDPMVSLIFPGLLFLLVGIFLPGGAVYLDQTRIDQRKRLWVDLGGIILDVFTLIFVVLVFWIVRDSASQVLVSVLTALIYLSFGYIFFNLLPIPPLDGFSALAELMPAHIREQMYIWRQKLGFFPLMFIFLFGGSFLGFIWQWSYALTSFLGGNGSNLAWGMSLIRLNI